METPCGSEIKKCVNMGNVDGKNNNCVGGIAGNIAHPSNTTVISDCYNIKHINGNGNIGGLTGYSTNLNMTNCYNAGAVQGNSKVGGLIGESSGTLTVTNSYYLTGTAASDTGNAAATEYAKDKTFLTTTFVTTAGTSVWEVVENKNNGFPILK